MYCPSCGQEIPDESQYCQHCGEAITTSVGNEKEKEEGKGFAFLHGLAGLIGGGLVSIFALIWFSSSQYIYPTQAAIALWLLFIGLGITILSPGWYWIGRPLGLGFGGVNPVESIQSTTQGYSPTQKAIGYSLVGLVLIFVSDTAFTGSTPLILKYGLILLTLIGFVILLIGVWRGGGIIMESVWGYGSD